MRFSTGLNSHGIPLLLMAMNFTVDGHLARAVHAYVFSRCSHRIGFAVQTGHLAQNIVQGHQGKTEAEHADNDQNQLFNQFHVICTVQPCGVLCCCIVICNSFISVNNHPGLFTEVAQIKQVNFLSHFQQVENGRPSLACIVGARQYCLAGTN